MECVEGALKSSFNHHQPLPFPNELWAVTANNLQNGAVGDDLFVDQLLDFSNAPPDDADPEEHQQLASENFNTYDGAATNTAVNTKSDVVLSSNDEFGYLPDSELGVTSDDLESLEWLSHFVEDSFSDYSLTCPVSKLPPEPTKVPAGTEILVLETKPSFTTPVQTKARTKRPRSASRVWSLDSPSLTESSSSSTSSSSTMTSSSCPGQCKNQTAESLLGGPPVKKQKKKPVVAESTGAGGGCGYGGTQQPRRCSHCGVQKTPQWRAGPHGAKTLCNACGVRYKSGRLLPEYRPVCSPTFSSELHSNNHRKVLEMRRTKELETGLTPPVQTF